VAEQRNVFSRVLQFCTHLNRWKREESSLKDLFESNSPEDPPKGFRFQVFLSCSSNIDLTSLYRQARRIRECRELRDKIAHPRTPKPGHRRSSSAGAAGDDVHQRQQYKLGAQERAWSVATTAIAESLLLFGAAFWYY